MHIDTHTHTSLIPMFDSCFNFMSKSASSADDGAIHNKQNTVEPLNKGHLGTQAAVPYSEVVPYWEVRDKTVNLCTFTASMMYKTHYGVIIMIQSA